MAKNPTPPKDEEQSQDLGQLSVDVYESPSELIVVAPIAGVKLSDINLNLTDDILTIEGHRQLEKEIHQNDYLIQECFWGKFSRSIVLPDNADTGRITASFKDGILKIAIPKSGGGQKTKLIRIRND